MPFDYNAFLGEEINYFTNETEINNRELYDLLYDFNRFINEKKYFIKHTSAIVKDNIILALFCKLIQTYNSIVLLAQRGLISDSKTLLRSLLETSINHNAIIYDEDYFDDYLGKGAIESLKLASQVKKNPSFFTEKIINQYSDEIICKLKVEADKVRRINNIELSDVAKLKDVYVGLYSTLCLDVHGNIKAIDKLLQKDGDIIKSINMTPSSEGHFEILYNSVWIMLTATKALSEYFSMNIENNLADYYVQMKMVVDSYLERLKG